MKILTFSIAALLTTSVLVAQPRELQKADELYNNYAYVDAIKIYEKIAKKGYESQELLSAWGMLIIITLSTRMLCLGMKNSLKKASTM